ncbi:MAG TPA: hypothetical protein DEG69_18305 [Flavobacteriaceae bacterium]|nr:hypothetical protein [Flavobacteriaceae bacterium]
MIKFDLNESEEKDESEWLKEGENIPVVITYVDRVVRNLYKVPTDYLRVKLESDDKKKIYHLIPEVKKFKWKVKELFIAVGLSEMKDGKEVVTSNEENDLVGKQLLIDIKLENSYLNVVATKKINAGDKDETGVQQSINAQSPSSKGVSINVPPEFDEKVKENLDF